MKIFLTLLSIIVISSWCVAQTPNDIMIKVQTPLEKEIFTGAGAILDELPADFPTVKVDSTDNPSPGSMFLNTFNLKTQTDGYIMVIDNSANPLYYKKVDKGVMDFKMGPNGLFSYAKAIANADVHNIGGFTVQNSRVIDYILDPSYKIIDSVQCKNGYLADPHEFLILPNGNYLTMAYEDIPLDMSKAVKGGNPNATVVGTVIQELDKNKNCVFQWRSVDNIPIGQTFDNVLNPTFEHVHGNAYYLDTDGNLLVSLATTFEIVKVNMVTGNIMWRFGGRKNQFAITGDNATYKPLYFSMQHDIKRLPNGNFLFYDNGFAKVPKFSRAVEYSVDEVNKTAAMVWEYRHTPDIASFAMGSVQRLPNGNTLIDWGMLLSGPKKMATEVTPDKKIVAEYSLPADNFSYRVLKYQLPACQPVAEVVMSEAKEGNTYKFEDANSNVGAELYVENIDAFTYNYLIAKKYECSPLNPEFEGEAPVLVPNRYKLDTKYINSFKGELRFDANLLPPRYNYQNMKVYFRTTEGMGVFKELTTKLDAENNTLVAAVTDSGEYVIGFIRVADVINAPIQMIPANNTFLRNNAKVAFAWTANGRYDNFELVIAEDTLCSTIVQTKTGLKTSLIALDLDPNKKYFWRVKTNYRNLTSEWSSVRSFRLTDPALFISYPKVTDTLYKDSTIIIRWATNIPDTLSITLQNNGSDAAVIKDALLSKTGAFAWKVPNTLADGNNYSIIIKSIKNNLLTQSVNNLTVIQHPVSVNDNNANAESVLNITPNPAGDYIEISWDAINPTVNRGVDETQDITIYNTLGECVISESIHPMTSSHRMNIEHLPRGVYFIRLGGETAKFVKM